MDGSWLTQFLAARPDLRTNTMGLANINGAGMALQPLGAAAGANDPNIAMYGLPAGLLGGQAAAWQPPLGPLGAVPQSSLGQPPTPPVAPDINSILNRATDARALAIGPNDFNVLQGKERAAAAGFQAQRNALPVPDPTAARFNPSPYTPQDLPPHGFAPIPTRPAPGHDPLSMGIAALAGLVDPRGAGAYNASPLQAGIDVANRQYQDKLQQFQQMQEQLNQQYAGDRANVEQQNAAGLFNLQNQQRATQALGNLQDELALKASPLVGGEASANSMVSSLGPLADQATGAAKAQATLQQAQEDIAAQQRQFELESQLFRDQWGPQARYMGVLEQQASLNGRNANTNTTKEQIASENNATKTGIAGANNASKEKIAGGHDATKTGIANADRAADAQNDIATPAGNAAKDPTVMNAYNLARDAAKTVDRWGLSLSNSWRLSGHDIKDTAGFQQFLSTYPPYQQALQDKATAKSAYDAALNAKQTQTPGGASNRGGPTGSAPGAPSPNTGRPTGYTYDPATGKMTPNR